MKMQRVVMSFLVTVFVCGSFPPLAKAQSSSGAGASSSTSAHNHRLPPTPSPVRHIKSRRMARRSATTFSTPSGPTQYLEAPLRPVLIRRPATESTAPGRAHLQNGAEVRAPTSSVSPATMESTSPRRRHATSWLRSSAKTQSIIVVNAAGSATVWFTRLMSTVATRHGDDGRYRFLGQ